jgi:hypothetical protein
LNCCCNCPIAIPEKDAWHSDSCRTQLLIAEIRVITITVRFPSLRKKKLGLYIDSCPFCLLIAEVRIATATVRLSSQRRTLDCRYTSHYCTALLSDCHPWKGRLA